MVIVWIAIAVGIIIAIALIVKITKAKPYDHFTFEKYCKKCGYETNGLKCPRCSQPSN